MPKAVISVEADTDIERVKAEKTKACKNHWQIPASNSISDPEDAAATECGSNMYRLTEPRSFNLMFQTFVGAMQDAASIAYLRPETAQGIFVNFKNVLDSTRLKLPFGIAQVGKAFRNEINPRNLHVPLARIRANGDRVFLPAGRVDEVV